MALINLNNVPGHQISGMDSEMLDWVTNQSGTRELFELGPEFINLLNNEEISLIDEEAEKSSSHFSNRQQYTELCSRLHVVPVTYFVQHMEDPLLVMKHHGLGPKGTKAIASVLQTNRSVEHLDLTGNWMEVEGASAMARMILINTFMSEIVLADNRLQSDGANFICKAIQRSYTIKVLDLSGNEIGDTACQWIAEILQTSKCLTELYLARNDIGSDGAEELADAVAYNDILEVLDLSWNKVRCPGALDLLNGIKENVRIKECNISWNGLGPESGACLERVLAENGTLNRLDLSGNRLDNQVVRGLSRALAANEALKELSLANNPITSATLLQLTLALEKSEVTQLEHLDFSNIPVHNEFIQAIERIRARKPDFVCNFGLALRTSNPEDMDKPFLDPATKLKRAMLAVPLEDNKFVHLLQEMDVDVTLCVTMDQFIQALNELEIPYQEAHLEDFQSKFDRFGNGTIYYGDFIPPPTNILEEEEESN